MQLLEGIPVFMVIYPADAEQAVILAELTKHVINPLLELNGFYFNKPDMR